MQEIISIFSFIFSFSSEGAWDQCVELFPLRNLVNEKDL